MPSIDLLLAVAVMASLTLYVLLGGADFGGGVWDLLAALAADGERKKVQRELIAEAIGPIWEANHVWLILVIVLLFTCFPPAFSVISTALHVPLVLMLIGIVLRGSAFTFRSYDRHDDDVQRRWGRVFSVASLITPVLLGVTVGAISSGRIAVKDGVVTTGFFHSWLAPFPFAVGLFALALFALLAAVYLTVEAPEDQLREDFRRRALVTAVIVGVLALTVFLLSSNGAPEIRRRLATSWWTWPLQIATAVAAVGGIWSLWGRKFKLARLCVAAQVTLILWGWAAAMFPYLVVPNLTIQNAAAPAVTLRLVLWALAAGSLLLFPSTYYLFRVFKSTAALR